MKAHARSSTIALWVTVAGVALAVLVRGVAGSEAPETPSHALVTHEQAVPDTGDEAANPPIVEESRPARPICAHPYLPVGEGASWTYRLSGGDGSGAVLSTLRVSAVRAVASELFAEIEARRGEHRDVSTIRCGDDRADEPWQLALVPFGERVRPFPLLRDLNAAETSTATFERPSFVRHGATDAVEVARRTVVRGEETVTVPAGTFRATHLSHPRCLGKRSAESRSRTWTTGSRMAWAS